MSANMTLAPAAESDAAAIFALEQQIFTEDAWSLALIKDELTANYRRYFKLEQDAKLVGYAGVLVVGDEADVQTIAVSSELRGQGWGKKLLQRLADEAVSQGAKQIFLEVRADNPAAIGLYQHSGFKQIAVRPQYYQPAGVDALIMRAQLPLKWKEIADAQDR
ncbi:ribosomal protein S18-alanine N-acetyltransferase [Canibacter zhoujuaniae]|uniref:ribosomal protein S18-alanine N-acetyltransferase n=1 Tax=Canibacter zhoujuaniae TaxID=2708343 RepID=UPI001423EFE8|nr:ribosomal protein S18-alanine N-acetyltransferase [Canibacter zhoujuaniae]